MKEPRAQLRAALLLGALLLASCGGGNTSSSGDDPASDAEPSGEVDPDGVVRIAVSSQLQTLDPHLECHQGCRGYWNPLFETLYDPTVEGEVTPLAAADLPTYADDGLSLTIPLREGRTFHDGTPIDAAAVKASLERAQTLPASTAAADLALLEAVEVVDPLTVRLVLESPRPGFEALLQAGPGALISPAALDAGVDIGSDPGDAGSGPFLLDSFIPNEKAVYIPAGDYDLDPNRGRATLEVNSVADTQASVSALRAGDYDLVWADHLDPELEQQILDEGLRVVNKPSVSSHGIFLRITEPPLDDLRVRQAISYAIDRETISEELYDGECEPRSQLMAPDQPGGTPGWDPFPYDPDKARDLLAEAGVDDVSFEALTVAGYPASENNAAVVQEMLAEVGIEMSIRPMASAEAVAAFANDEAAARVGSLGFRHDALGTMESLYLAGGTNHMAVPEDGPLEELRTELGTASPERQAEILTEMGTYISENAFAISLCQASADFVTTPGVLGMDDMRFTYVNAYDFRGLAMSA